MTFRAYQMVHPDDFEPIFVFSLKFERGQVVPLSDEIIDWCQEQFGEEDRVRWERGYDTVMFKQESDAAAFKLRWY